MDAASAAAGAGKMSAYRHFAGKDDLLAAVLERYNRRHLQWLLGDGRTARAESAPAGPVSRILSAFDRLESAAGGESFRGCPFVDAALAAPGPDPRVGVIAARHKEDLIRELTGLVAQTGRPEPDELAAAVALVIDGATVQAALAPDRASRQRIVRRGRRVAETILAPAGQS